MYEPLRIAQRKLVGEIGLAKRSGVLHQVRQRQQLIQPANAQYRLLDGDPVQQNRGEAERREPQSRDADAAAEIDRYAGTMSFANSIEERSDVQFIYSLAGYIGAMSSAGIDQIVAVNIQWLCHVLIRFIKQHRWRRKKGIWKACRV